MPRWTEEERSYWRCEWLTSIQEMSDGSMQRSAWLNPKPRTWNPHYSFIEFYITYMDRVEGPLNGVDYDFRVGEGLLKPEEARVVAGLHELIRSYQAPNGDYDQRAILDDVNWHAIVAAAVAAQAELTKIISDPVELDHLLKRSPHAIEAMLQGPPYAKPPTVSILRMPPPPK